MLRWFRRRRLSEAGGRRLALSLARAEETLVDTHVANVLDVYEAVGDETPLSSVVDLYLDTMAVAEPQASIIARRVLARSQGAQRPRRRSRGRRSE